MRPRWSCEGGNGEKRSFSISMTRIHWPPVLGWDVFEEGAGKKKSHDAQQVSCFFLLSFLDRGT